MRSAYFGQKAKVNKDDKIYTLDGITCEFEPEYADAQRNIKQAVHKKITNLIRDKVNFYLICRINLLTYKILQKLEHK